MNIVSPSASTRQPAMQGGRYTFNEYTTSNDAVHLAVGVDIRDMAAFYAEHPLQRGWYEHRWDSADPNTYIPIPITNADAALDAVAAFTLPPDQRADAYRVASQLYGVFEYTARPVAHRDQLTGRLDRRKLPTVAGALAANNYRAEEVRPYRRMESAPVQPPTIAIVGSAGNAEMWADEHYIPRVFALALGLVWACEAAGLRSYAFLTKGYWKLNPYGRYASAVELIQLAAPGVTVPWDAYAVAFHRDLWRHGSMTMQMADLDANQRLLSLGAKRHWSSAQPQIGHSFPSINGGNAVQAVRTLYRPDILIAIGNIQDAPRAHIRLETEFQIADAVRAIAEQAKFL